MMISAKNPILVLVSAGAEWKIVEGRYAGSLLKRTPFGGYFDIEINGQPVILMHGGWGKISAAASAQYAIDRWQPIMIFNLGTCGGFGQSIQPGDVVMAQETLVYDIYERMGDAQQALNKYAVRLDLSWLGEPYPLEVKKVRLLSADRDIDPGEIVALQTRFQAIAADWESGAIAWVAQRNGIKCLVLRGVSDLVTSDGGEAYGSLDVFLEGTRLVMERLLESLPGWISGVKRVH